MYGPPDVVVEATALVDGVVTAVVVAAVVVVAGTHAVVIVTPTVAVVARGVVVIDVTAPSDPSVSEQAPAIRASTSITAGRLIP
jgi:hypothetical protein